MWTWRNEEQILENQKKRHHTSWGVLQFLISPSKGNEKKRSYYHTGYSFLVTHPGTNPAKQGSTLLSGRHMVLSLQYSDSERIFFLISKMRKSKITDIGWEKMRGMKMRIITCLNVFNSILLSLIFSYILHVGILLPLRFCTISS